MQYLCSLCFHIGSCWEPSGLTARLRVRHASFYYLSDLVPCNFCIRFVFQRDALVTLRGLFLQDAHGTGLFTLSHSAAAWGSCE